MNNPDDSPRSPANEPPSNEGSPRRPAPNERWFITGALALIWAGALAALWSVLCRQSPASPYFVRGLYELVEGLSIRLWIIAALTLACAGLAAKGALFASTNPARAWLLFVLWSAGALLHTGSIAWSAATGAVAVQVRDSGQRGHRALVARWLGAAMLMGSLAIAQRSLVRGAIEARS